jgi:hypothetical protein
MNNPVSELTHNLGQALNNVNYQTWICLVVLAFLAWGRFNTWTPNEEDFGKSSPPRHFTTWKRYASYGILYTLIIEAVYFFIVITPDILDLIADFFDAPKDRPFLDTARTENVSLWVLLFLVAVLPGIPVLRDLEIRLRRKLHYYAFIPAEARALVHELSAKPNIFRPHRDTASAVLKKLREELPRAQDFTDPVNSIEHKWFKLTYLQNKIDEWKGQRVASRFYTACGKDYAVCDDLHDRLKIDIRIYSDKKAANIDREYLDRLGEGIGLDLDRLLTRTYEFIVCGILATEKMHSKRMESLSKFGIYPSYKPGIPIILDTIIRSAFLVFLSTLLITAIFMTFQGKPPHESIAKSALWSFIFLLMQGFSILGAVLLFRKISRSERFGKPPIGNPTFVLGPIAHATIAFFMGYGIALVIVVLNAKAFLLQETRWLEVAARIWAWALIPATTSAFIVYYLSAVKDGKEKRKRFLDAAALGASSASMAAIAVALMPVRPDAGVNIGFMIYAVVTCGLAGFGIGFTFPTEYQSRVKALYQGPERRTQSRVSTFLETILRIEDEAYPCETENLSATGAELAIEVPHGIGTKASFNLAGIGKLEGTIVRKTGTSTCIQFHPVEGLRPRLEAFVMRQGLALP